MVTCSTYLSVPWDPRYATGSTVCHGIHVTGRLGKNCFLPSKTAHLCCFCFPLSTTSSSLSGQQSSVKAEPGALSCHTPGSVSGWGCAVAPWSPFTRLLVCLTQLPHTHTSHHKLSQGQGYSVPSGPLALRVWSSTHTVGV